MSVGERRYPWGFMSFMVAVAGIGIGLYVGLHEPRPSLTLEIESETDVLDVRRGLEELSITFRGQDISETGENLRIIVVRLSNDGQVDITENLYDQRLPFGILASGASLIEARILASNSEYLSENLSPEIVSEGFLRLEKVILERGKYVVLELVARHPTGSPPTLRFEGKIAGIDSVAVLPASRERETVSLSDEAFRGGLFVQVLRAVTYFILTLFLGALVAGLVVVGRKIAQAQARKARQRRFQHLSEMLHTEPWASVLMHLFVEGGRDAVDLLAKMVLETTSLPQGRSGRPTEVDTFSLGLAVRDAALRARGARFLGVTGQVEHAVCELFHQGVIDLNTDSDLIWREEFEKDVKILSAWVRGVLP